MVHVKQSTWAAGTGIFIYGLKFFQRREIQSNHMNFRLSRDQGKFRTPGRSRYRYVYEEKGERHAVMQQQY